MTTQTMTYSRSLTWISVVAWCLLLTTEVLAGPKTLFKVRGDKLKDGLATVTSHSPGSLEFELGDHKVGKKKITIAMVKASVENKLSAFSAKVSGTGNSGKITYKGDEKEFLKKLSRTRIKSKSSSALALESSTSDGGIRAKTAVRKPKDNEIKGQVVSVKNGVLNLVVTETGNSALASSAKPGKKIKVTGFPKKFNPKKRAFLYFTPLKKGDPWNGKDFILE